MGPPCRTVRAAGVGNGSETTESESLARLQRDLNTLLKHLRALSPTTPALIPSPPFPSSAQLSLPASQAYLVRHFLGHQEHGELIDDENGAAGWRRLFWRRVVRACEDGLALRRDESGLDLDDEEVDERLLATVIKYLPVSLTPPGMTLRTACWGAITDPSRWSQLQTWEEGKIITDGTTGLRTWHACVALCNHLLARPAWITSRTSILECGAGVGLLSLVSARISPDTARIVATDVDEHVLERLQKNIAVNNLEKRVSVSKLDWDWILTLDGTRELAQWEETTYSGASRPDLIIGADIVYDPSLTAQLAATLAFLLRPFPRTPPDLASQKGHAGLKRPEALIASTIRQESTWIGFLSHCESCGLRTEQLELVDIGQDGIVGAEGWEGEGEVRLLRVSAGTEQNARSSGA